MGNWIKSAVPKSHEGVFTAKAKRAGMGVQEYAEKESSAPGKLGREARLARTFGKMAARKKSPLYKDD